ncbi:MAG: lipid-A-disaccharide synthase [Acidobacteria bacterium]|nr:lipid-A-disaccharide synthase [Acidobacteriota bacterium]
MDILVSAGEASGDMYASRLVEELRKLAPGLRFYGCAGPQMRAAGVEPVVDAEALAVVGLVEVVGHIPRIYGEFRKLVAAAERRRPALAILTDSPDFNLRVAKKLKRLGIPVIYLVAPQVWAWRSGRVKQMRRDLAGILSIFPFEKAWFAERGVAVDFIGHPLAWSAAPRGTRCEFCSRHGLDETKPILVLLPGSRVGEARRHLPAALDAVEILRSHGYRQFVWATPVGFLARGSGSFTTFRERISALSIHTIEGETWDAIAYADLALAASGTVTMEAAMLGTAMVSFYRVTAISWLLGKLLVSVPFYTMVNLVAGRCVVPELMQTELTGANLARAALHLLETPGALATMRAELAGIRHTLRRETDPLAEAARVLADRYLKET